MQITVNGEAKTFNDGVTVAQMIIELGLDTKKVAVERNLAIVPRSQYEAVLLDERDAIEIVHFIGGGAPRHRHEPKLMSTEPKLMSDEPVLPGTRHQAPNASSDPFTIAGRRFTSRLLVGTGKYKDMSETKAATEASGAEIVTVALRRVDLSQQGAGSLTATLDPKHYTYLPNSAGCYTAEEAVRTLRLARELGGWELVKLEVIGDKTSLYPDVGETLKAAEILIGEGFQVMAYTNDDPIAAKKLEQMGCVAVMPLAAPIGSGLGIQNPLNIRLIVEEAKVPILVDAGVGTASDAAIAMELGCDGVLMNTAIAEAKDPVMMAQAMKQAVIAGRLAFLAGRMPKRGMASASSPAKGLLNAG